MKDLKYLSDTTRQFENKIIIVTGSTQGSGAETGTIVPPAASNASFRFDFKTTFLNNKQSL